MIAYVSCKNGHVDFDPVASFGGTNAKWDVVSGNIYPGRSEKGVIVAKPATKTLVGNTDLITLSFDDVLKDFSVGEHEPKPTPVGIAELIAWTSLHHLLG